MRCLTVLVLILSATSLLGAQKPVTDAERAKALFREGKRAESLLILERLCAGKGATADLVAIMGMIYLEPPYQNGTLARRYFLRALSMDKNEPNANYGMGALYRRMGQFAPALTYLERAAKDPAFAPAQLELGITYYATSQFDKATRAFQLAAKPTHANGSLQFPQAVEYLALVASQLGKHGAAAELTRKLVLKMGPKWKERPRTLFQGAAFLIKAGRHKESIPILEKSIELGFAKTEAFNALGLARYEMGMLNESYEAYGHSLEKASYRGPKESAGAHADAHYRRGLIRYRQKNYVEAVAHLDRAVAANKFHKNAWYKLGQAHQRLKNMEKAKEAFAFHKKVQPLLQKLRSVELTLNNDPASLKNRLGYGLLLSQLERWEESYRQLEIVLRADPERAGLYEAIIHIAEKTGQKNAIEMFRMRMKERDEKKVNPKK